MQNTAIIACAGAGKTYTICRRALSLSGKSLMVTYTNRGRDAINNQISQSNHGLQSKKIVVETWFEFLLREIIKPYQSNLDLKMCGPNKIKSIDFSDTHKINYHLQSYDRYVTSQGNIRQNEVANVAYRLLKLVGNKIVFRLLQQFEFLFFDEFQDLTGRDIDIVEYLMKSQIKITIVGDPKQATFRTHESRVNKNKSGANFGTWVSELSKKGLLKVESTQKSRRFGKQIADLANMVDPRLKVLTGTNQGSRDHQGIFIVPINESESYMDKFNVICLVLNQSIRKEIPQSQITYNFGECKGLTFSDTLIVCPRPLEEFLLSGKPLKSNLAKYYIAVTRARYSVAFAVKDVLDVKRKHPEWKEWYDPKVLDHNLATQLKLF